MAVPMLNRRSYVVEREAPGAHASSGPLAGQWVPGAVSVTAVSGSLQPVTDRDAMLLPEGVRERAKSKLYTDPTAVLQTWGIDSQTRGDIVVDEDGERLQVWGTRGYHRAQLDHRRYMLVREPDAR